MAKKRLTKAIEELFNSIETNPLAEARTLKNPVMALLPLAEALEDGSAIGEAETQITSLEEQIANLGLQLKESNKEVEAFRAERKKQEDEKRREDINDIQFQILERLPSPSGTDWLRSDEIARALKIELDEADAYTDGLKGLGFIIFHPHEPGGGGWVRTAKGNRLAVSKRWTSGEKGKRKVYKYPDREPIQHEALLMMAKAPDEGAISEHYGVYEQEVANKVGASLREVQRNLRELRKDEMATDGNEPQQTYGAGTVWWLLEKGEDYLAERDLL